MGHTPDAYAELLGALLLDPWGDQASCIGKADVLEAPNETPAKTMCAYCPVIAECTTWVLGLSHKQDPGGVRAGMNESQRHRARRLVAVAKAATEKWCPGCEKTKPGKAFHRNYSHNDNLSTQCRDCNNKRTAERRKDRRAAA